jgi:hypothetical protein
VITEQYHARAYIPSVIAGGASYLFSATRGAAVLNPATKTPATTALENFISTIQLILSARPSICILGKERRRASRVEREQASKITVCASTEEQEKQYTECIEQKRNKKEARETPTSLCIPSRIQPPSLLPVHYIVNTRKRNAHAGPARKTIINIKPQVARLVGPETEPIVSAREFCDPLLSTWPEGFVGAWRAGVLWIVHAGSGTCNWSKTAIAALYSVHAGGLGMAVARQLTSYFVVVMPSA